MVKAKTVWNVLAHGSFDKLADNLWWVQGTLPNMSLKRNMTVVRLRDGRLVLHNAIALEDGMMRALEAWGGPAFLIVPSGIHRLDAPAYKQRYPNLRVLAPVGSRSKVAEVICVDGVYEDFETTPELSFETLAGVDEREGAMLVRSADGLTIVLNDAVFNMDRKRDVLGFLFTTAFGSAPGPRVSRLAKLTLVRDPHALRDHLLRLAALPSLTRLIVAHEKIAHGADARAALEHAATFL